MSASGGRSARGGSELEEKKRWNAGRGIATVPRPRRTLRHPKPISTTRGIETPSRHSWWRSFWRSWSAGSWPRPL